jgi:hypothetical protein
MRLQVFGRMSELALFDLGIDSKLRACDLLKLKVRDVCDDERVAPRTIVMHKRLQDRCSSRSGSRHGLLWPTGSNCLVFGMTRAGSLLTKRISISSSKIQTNMWLNMTGIARWASHTENGHKDTVDPEAFTIVKANCMSTHEILDD